MKTALEAKVIGEIEAVEMAKFIERRLKHNSTRQDDILKLEDCLQTLQAGKQLDPTQYAFVKDLQREQKERNKRYYRNKLNKAALGEYLEYVKHSNGK